MSELKRTPLYDAHVALGAKMVDFAGFEMPVKYSSESAEHLAVRNSCGVFDVSHMGEILVEGPDALDFIQRLVTNDATAITDGQAMYAGMLDDEGTFVDDVIVYRFNTEKFFICVNAGNRAKDWQQVEYVAREFPNLRLRDEGDQWAQIAVQGPKAVDVVAALFGEETRAIKGYHFETRGASIVARTGYTGEDGFELYVPVEHAASVWVAVLVVSQSMGGLPCGLACRDTLRLEAGMCLYGNDIDDTHTPLEANLGWIVKLDAPRKKPFVGSEALRAQKQDGVPRLLRGLEMIERGIARHGYNVFAAAEGGAQIGVVTSGTQAPFLNKAIAFAYLDKPHDALGGDVFVDIRGKRLRAKVVKLPFYKRAAT